MTFDFLQSDPLLVYGIVGGFVLTVILIATLYIMRKRQTVSNDVGKIGSNSVRLAYQPEARPVRVVPLSAIPKPTRKSPTGPALKEISLLKDRQDITESLLALTDKYSLDQFTIATSDGLIFASSRGNGAQTDAAHYSEIFNNDPLAETPGVTLTGFNHKGSDLVLIIRTHLPVPDEIRIGIEEDTKDILNWWI